MNGTFSLSVISYYTETIITHYKIVKHLYQLYLL